MGGVRIQALGLEAYSTLTEEDGTFKLDIPTFSDALYVYAEGYNPTQVQFTRIFVSPGRIAVPFQAR